MANKIPEVFKIAFFPSILSKMTPKNLTATQKMMLARARIWNEIIGGNSRTGNRLARTPFKGDSMERYFDFSTEEFFYPFKNVPDEINDQMDEYREVRNVRKGKCIVHTPKLVYHAVPRKERKRYLFMEKRRLDREAQNNIPKRKRSED